MLVEKGDILMSNVEAWEVKEKQSGICLCQLIWYKGPELQLKPGSKATFSLSHIKHKLVAEHFKLIPKAKKSTIQVLFT